MSPEPEKCIPDLVRLLIGREDAGTAIRTSDAVLSYDELARLVETTAGRLLAAGVQPGDRVLVIFSTAVPFIVAVLASMAARCIAVPLSGDTGPGRVRYVVDATAPRVCLVHSEARLPAGASSVVRFGLDGSASRFSPDPGEHRGPAPPTRTADEPAMILFSSGSTGRPKGVVLRHGSLCWTAQTLARTFGLDRSHAELIISPLSHSGAWQRAAATLSAGGTVVPYEGTLSISGILEYAERHGIHGFYTAPPLIRYFLKDVAAVRRALAGTRSIEIGSAPLGESELEQLMDLVPSIRVFVHYGLTECSRGVILDARAHPDKWHTVGRPRPGGDVAVCDESGNPVATGRRGEIRLRGPQLADSYWRQPELTRERFVDGWVLTGDYGRLDADGFLTFLGREDDMITSAGYSFFPVEVETELGSVPGVERYQIAGVTDPRGMLGQLPYAFVVPSDAESWSADQFTVPARKRLPPHMVPRKIVVVPDLPMTASGKPDRRSTVRRYMAGDAKE